MSSSASHHEVMLEKLEHVLSAEDFEQVKGLPESLLVGIYNQHESQIKEVDNEALYVEQRISAWKDDVMERIDADGDVEDTTIKDLCGALKDCGLIGGENWCGGTGPFKAKGPKKECAKLDKTACKYIHQLIREHQKQVADKFDAEHIKKPKVGGGGGKRGKFSGERREINTKDTAEGKDNKFYFVGDEIATFTKPTFTSKDGEYQNITHKAVKHKRYMGGADSVETDGKCVGAVGWDRAQGSVAIKKAGLSYAQFRIRCDENKGSPSGWCRKCLCKDDKQNFFTGKYKIGKGAGQKLNGVGYKQFIVDNLTYAS
jgi:hypothetical protein